MQHVREFLPKQTDKILIVSPHPDDETLAMGGVVIKYHQQIDILLLTSGEVDKNIDLLNKKKETRLREMQDALDLAGGVNSFTNLDLPVYSLSKHSSKKIIQRYAIKDYQYIFVPHRNEHHLDHRCLYKIFKKMIRIQHSKASLIEYESTTALQLLYYYFDLSDPDILKRKRSMMNCYSSQISGFNYDGIHMGLSEYQGALVHKKYIEAFYMTPRYYSLKRLYIKLPVKIKKIIEPISRKLFVN